MLGTAIITSLQGRQAFQRDHVYFSARLTQVPTDGIWRKAESSLLQFRDKLKVMLKTKPKLAWGPTGTHHSLAATGRSEEALKMLMQPYLSMERSLFNTLELVRREKPTILWERATVKSSQKIALSGLGKVS